MSRTRRHQRRLSDPFEPGGGRAAVAQAGGVVGQRVRELSPRRSYAIAVPSRDLTV
jgi:hypothetical protein